jgi:hypothetical protein
VVSAKESCTSVDMHRSKVRSKARTLNELELELELEVILAAMASLSLISQSQFCIDRCEMTPIYRKKCTCMQVQVMDNAVAYIKLFKNSGGI